MIHHSEKEQAGFVEEIDAGLCPLNRELWRVAVNDVMANVIESGQSLSVVLVSLTGVRPIRLAHLKWPYFFGFATMNGCGGASRR